MSLLAISLSILILIVELRRCTKRKTITCAVIAASFNIVFLHVWLILSLFGMEHDVYDERVTLYIALSDLTWLFMAVFYKDKLQCNVFVGRTRTEVLPVFLFYAFTYLVGLYYISGVGISLLSEEVEWARHISKKGHGYLNIFITRGSLLAALLVFVLYMTGSIKRTTTAMMIVAVLLLQLATGFRSYVITTALAMWLAYINITGRFNLSKMVYAGITGLMLFSAITAYKSNLLLSGGGLAGAWEAIWPYVNHRVVMEVPRIIGRILYLTDINGLALGQTYIWDFYAAMPGPGYSFGDRLFLWLATKQEIAGIAPIPPGLIGESLMNFGGLGVPVGMGAGYWLIKYVDSIRGDNMLDVAIKAILSVLIAEVVFLGIGVVFISRLFPLMAFIGIYLFERRLLTGRLVVAR